jgi:ABC-type multidrug transport system fused ATPase/permease subunit
MSSSESVAAEYRQRRDEFHRSARIESQRSDRLANIRVSVFLLAAAITVGVATSHFATWPLLLSVIAIGLVLFIIVVARHAAIRRRVERLEALVRVNDMGLARLARRWDQLPTALAPERHARDPVARDLDLFGPASLFQLLCTAQTPVGRETLAAWLVQTAPTDTLARRHQAIQELAPQIDGRQDLQVAGRRLAQSTPDTERFFTWAESRAWLTGRRGLIWAARILPVLLLIGLLGAGLGWWSNTWTSLVLLSQIALSYFYVPRITQVFSQVSARAGEVRHYARLFELMAHWPVQAPLLQELNAAIADEAQRELDRLRRIMDLADLRYSAIVYAIIQALFLWDFHVLGMLEQWQQRNGSHVRRWFAALGEFEALCSLANLAHDQPEWTFAQLSTDHNDRFTAQALGHPLLSDQVRVANDVEVGPPETVLVVSGSNMSGKSTLLRAIGLNVVLAQAGAPTCSRLCQLGPLTLATSMRVQDSLAEGVSLFLAELQRLKQVVDLARRKAEQGGPRVLFLLDEILHGTNTAERQIAVRHVVAHLMAHGAIGAVSTHDLQLADEEPLQSAAVPVHFRETFHSGPDGESMSFDYHLLPGWATSTNALKLLRLVGLGSAKSLVEGA